MQTPRHSSLPTFPSQNPLKWDWKQALLLNCHNIDNVLDKIHVIIDMAELDVQNILRSCRQYRWIANASNYFDIYRTACNEIIKKLEKIRVAEAFCKNKTPTDALRWIISRVANETKNLFDPATKNNVDPTMANMQNDDYIQTVSKTDNDEQIAKINDKEIIIALKKMWRENLDINDVEHICIKFKIDKSEVFGNFQKRKYLKKNEKSRQSFINFDGEEI